MMKTNFTTQRWSDGLVSFICLGDQNIKCPMNGIFNIFHQAGSLCLLGLAKRQPLRGSIDIAWGAEIHSGELYGPAIARSYELESEIAQYPRIVISSDCVEYLVHQMHNNEEDFFSQYNQKLAKLCLDMLVEDVDGYMIVHYLGNVFRNFLSQLDYCQLYDMAYQYVEDKRKEFSKDKQSKLAFRYAFLSIYFDAHRSCECKKIYTCPR